MRLRLLNRDQRRHFNGLFPAALPRSLKMALAPKGFFFSKSLADLHTYLAAWSARPRQLETLFKLPADGCT